MYDQYNSGIPKANKQVVKIIITSFFHSWLDFVSLISHPIINPTEINMIILTMRLWFESIYFTKSSVLIYWTAVIATYARRSFRTNIIFRISELPFKILKTVFTLLLTYTGKEGFVTSFFYFFKKFSKIYISCSQQF